MKIPNVPVLLVLIAIFTISDARMGRRKRSVSNSLGDVLGISGSSTGNKRKKVNPVKITPPLRLKPGETAERAPGWTHCIKYMRASLTWKNLKSPGYPDFLESQIQCSWMIEAPIGMRVKIAFRDLDMIGATGSCAKQFAQIIDIATGKSQGRFCGSQRPGDYVTLGTKARIDLQADKAVTQVRGFLISVLAVKEIPGFRSSKTFSSMLKGTDSAPGKVDVKHFLSNTNSNDPKPAPGAKRASKRLVYESDRNPEITDPSATTTESGPSNTVGSDGDFGWIGNDADINTGQGGARSPSGRPLKVRTGNRQRTRPAPPTNNGPIIITASTLPVRIRAKNLVTPSEDPEIELENQGPIIYGQEMQPYDPTLYSTLHPVRADVNRFEDHRPEELTTTNLIIIIACAGLFAMMLAAIVLFWWFYRKRRIRKKKRREKEQRKKEEQERKDRMEMNVINLGDERDEEMKMREVGRMERQRDLPEPPPIGRDSPPRYPGKREFSYPRDGAMDRNDREDQLYPRYPRDGAMERGYDGEDARYPRPVHPTQRNQGEISSISRHDMELRHEEHQRRDKPQRDDVRRDVRPYRNERYPGHPVDYRHRTVDPRREEPRMPTSQLRHHSLDPRNLDRDHQLDRSRSEFRGKEPPRHPQDSPRNNSVIPPRYPNGGHPRGNSRQGNFPNGITGGDDVDEDYCSGASNTSGSGRAPMRREYSAWEVEQQKKERRKKLINGEL